MHAPVAGERMMRTKRGKIFFLSLVNGDFFLGGGERREEGSLVVVSLGARYDDDKDNGLGGSDASGGLQVLST